MLSEPVPPRVFDAADLSGDGHLDLLGIVSDGQRFRR